MRPFLYIIDPLLSLNQATDTTLALMQEAQTRSVANFACELKDLFLRDGRLHCLARPVHMKGDEPVYAGPASSYVAEDFAVIFMRKDPPVDECYLSALFMLRCVDRAKTLMINDPDGILLANEKLYGQKIAPQFFIDTLVATHKKTIHDFSQKHDTVVLKPLYKSGGAGVLVFNKDDRNLSSALEIVSDNYSQPIMIQSYIKNARAGDKRIIVLGGNAMGAINRIPHASDHRANVHAGGNASAATLEERDLEIVAALKPHLLARGLHLVGIDVIGGYLSEINVTSPTCVREIEQLSQKAGEKPLRAQICDYIFELIA